MSVSFFCLSDSGRGRWADAKTVADVCKYSHSAITREPVRAGRCRHAPWVALRIEKTQRIGAWKTTRRHDLPAERSQQAFEPLRVLGAEML
jgi:hypothetical protein